MSVSDRKRHPTRFPPNERYPVGGCHPRKITAATEFQKPMLRSGQEPSNAKIQWQLPRTRTWPGPIKGRIATDATEDIPRPVKSNAIACARICSLSFSLFLSRSFSFSLFYLLPSRCAQYSQGTRMRVHMRAACVCPGS